LGSRVKEENATGMGCKNPDNGEKKKTGWLDVE